MNELRWILLGIGVLIIACIYFFEVIKQKRSIRSRVEKYPGFNHESIFSLNINPEKEKNIDISGALETFNSYLRQVKAGSGRRKNEKSLPVSGKNNMDNTAEPATAGMKKDADGAAETGQHIMVLYITAQSVPRFYGNDILEAMNTAELQYGDMKIFHYYGPDRNHSNRALFSIANMHEPGTFDIDSMDSFVTDGLAMFMCLPAEIGGDIAFEIMLDTARNLAGQLGGELRGPDRQFLDTDSVIKMQEIASKY